MPCYFPPEVPLTHPAPHPVVARAQAMGLRITSDIELLLEANPNATFVGITGTNGKSTTTALIGHILQQAGKQVAVGGNIGVPALALPAMAGEDGIYVLELSSYQLDLLKESKARFQVAVWLNISPDHLDRHGDIEGYVAAKETIFAGQAAEDIAVVGIDDAYSEAVARGLIAQENQRVMPISVSQSCREGGWAKDGLLHLPEVIAAGDIALQGCEALRGLHNYQNAAAATAVCLALGVAPEIIAAALASFGGLAHRMQRVATHEGVVFVNDSKATNADAAAKSLGSYENIYWIAGGVPKAGGIEPLHPYFSRIRCAYLIGEAAPAFANTLQGHVPSVQCASLAEAVARAAADASAAQHGGVVLLAPACASFDQFANFEARGDAFCAAVASLAHQMAG
jgi:UDP-N-acetylmuramoylalanine--D-glutamate ligase